MKRTLVTALIAFSSVAIYAQQGNVGINTTTPKSTLDVVGNPTDTSHFDGLIAPRITGDQLRAKTYTTDQTGALVYVTAADSAPAGQTIDVTTAGYYFFDGTKWIVVKTPVSVNNDWGLTGNAGTTAGTNFVGTTDNQDLVFKRNNIKAGQISSDNTGLGVESFNGLTTGTMNTAIGWWAMRKNSTGSYNVALGASSLNSNTTGSNNIAIGGYNALNYNTIGSHNIAIGEQSLGYNSSGNQNTALGEASLSHNVSGNSGTAIGYGSQQFANDTSTSWTNTNTSVGYQSLRGSATSANNTGIGNTAIGYQSLLNNTTGTNNIANGQLALFYNTSGSYNTAIGLSALSANTTGNKNLSVGYDSGNNLTSGDNNIAIGATTDLPSATSSNQMNIGNAIFGTNMTGTVSTPAGNIGIGTSAPDASAVLDVSSSNKGVVFPRINLTSNTLDLDGTAGQAVGLLVYNTGSTLTKGYYYWDGQFWLRLESGGVFRNVSIVTGSRTSANPYIVSPSDYYVFFRPTAGISGVVSASATAPYLNTNYNIQLPDPTLNLGRELYLINDSGALGGTRMYAYTNYPIFGKGLNDTGNYTSPNTSGGYLGSYAIDPYYSKVKIMSDGIRWIIVNIDVI